jgi:hypothetical protein
MADLDAVRLQAELVCEAERLAIAGLAEYLQQAVEVLPDESRLCQAFLKCSDDLVDMADYDTKRNTLSALRLMRLERELRLLGPGEEEE